MGTRSPNSFVCLPVTEENYFKIISSFLSKGCNRYAVPVFIHKCLATLISPIVCLLFKRSILEGIYPGCIKTGTVIPLYKAGDNNMLNNDRPITALPILSKIFERLMHARMVTFINRYNLINPFQIYLGQVYEYKRCSLKFCHNTHLSLDNRGINCTVFLDFKIGFDGVDIDILLEKLPYLGLRGVIYVDFVF